MLEILKIEKSLGKELVKNKDFTNELKMNLENNKEDFNKIITSILKNGIEYAIKSLNISRESDGLCNDIKEIAKSKELKEIVETSTNVSISQALENNKYDMSKLKNLNDFKDTVIKGGFKLLLTAGIDILFSKVMKLNLFKPFVQKVTKIVKDFVMSKSFGEKINKAINKIQEKNDLFKDICKKWYKAYDEFNIEEINNIAEELEVKKNSVLSNIECMKENNIIQNMTKLINSKKDKLSQIQLQICSEL